MIGFFPGKFQPPHIGHAVTISKLLADKYYDKIIVGVSEDKPRVIDVDDIIETFSFIFPDENRITFCKISGTLIKYTKEETKDLPEFDVVITGNEKVIRWANDMGYIVELCPRTKGMGCSSTEIRRLYK